MYNLEFLNPRRPKVNASGLSSFGQLIVIPYFNVQNCFFQSETESLIYL